MSNNKLLPEVMAELRDAAEKTAAAVRDPEVARHACERIDRMREELRQKHGEMNVAVDLIRETREAE
jgi:hypothetical protein